MTQEPPPARDPDAPAPADPPPPPAAPPPPPEPPALAAPPPPTPPPLPARVRRLQRSRRERVLGGVGGGVAEYFDIDPVLARVGFVALAIVSGGIAIPAYILAWILMPEAPAGPDDATTPSPRAESRGPLSAGLLFGLLLILLGVVWLLRELDVADVNVGAALAVVLIAVGALLVVTLGAVARGGLLVLGVVLTAILATGASLDTTFDADTAFGDRTEQPATLAELDASYSHAFGSLTLDLTRITFPTGTTRVEASAAFGSLTVIVPRGVGVRVDAHVSFGSVDALDDEVSAGPVRANRVTRSADYDRAERKLDLKIDAAFGSVEVSER